MPDRVLVAVAHGSTDPRASATIEELIAIARERAEERAVESGRSAPVLRTAYLGHAAPSLPQVMNTIGPGAEVTVLPLLLTAAYHSKTDIPRELARTSLRAERVSYGAPLGPHPLLLRALRRRLTEEDPAGDRSRTGVVLAAAGSSDPEANATIARLAAQWQARDGWLAVRPAYQQPPPHAQIATNPCGELEAEVEGVNKSCGELEGSVGRSPRPVPTRSPRPY